MSFAFQARCRGDDTAVTIIAHDMEHASLIFAEWLRNHRGHIISQFMDFRVFTDRHVYAQPEMRDLMEAGYTGVCYWLEEPEVWTIAPPHMPAKGPLERPVRIKAFAFHHGKESALWVFAEDVAEAHAIYDIWHRDTWGCPAEWDKITPLLPHKIPMEKSMLLEDMDEGRKGIAEQDDEGDWRICPPERV
ncbi:hypothetical protein EOE18_04175 [Novosphingobium umbonatum]|uniref:Uncharacterized protein n=1 Tax=Novosphingobium umbonatum TaxID=1908524 RepID=A0A437NB81_9SPHN|nr:hypothetical protein [Novosphingobium umbonatum]RVU07147.1 hypothetical protein EOE18_04175 [Novosphingobium umbonatum]